MTQGISLYLSIYKIIDRENAKVPSQATNVVFVRPVRTHLPGSCCKDGDLLPLQSSELGITFIFTLVQFDFDGQYDLSRAPLPPASLLRSHKNAPLLSGFVLPRSSPVVQVDGLGTSKPRGAQVGSRIYSTWTPHQATFDRSALA